MRTAIALVLSLCATAASAGPLEAKVDRLQRAASKKTERLLGNKQALVSLSRNKQLKQGLGLSGDKIVLGERKTEGGRSRVVYSRALGWFGDEFHMSIADKVKRTEQLVLTKNGLEIHGYEQHAPVTKKTITALTKDVERQFAGKPSHVRMPDLKIEHDEFGAEQHTDRTQMRVGGIGLFSSKQKLDLAAWTHVDEASIQKAVDTWTKK